MEEGAKFNAPEPEFVDSAESTNESSVSLTRAVETTMETYLAAMKQENRQITDLYDTFLQEVEGPLLAVVMNRTSFNQSKAAKMLGLNRGTLRKKLKRYDLL